MITLENNDSPAPPESIRLAEDALVRFQSSWFWWHVFKHPLQTREDVEVVIMGLAKRGGRKGWMAAAKIARCL